jgi:sialate O-acetylesterase
MNRIIPFFFAFSALISIGLGDDESHLRLPALFSEHMVLQGDQADPVWGWAPAGVAVKIDFQDAGGKSIAHADATTGADGRWSADLPKLNSGAAGQLIITAGSESKTIPDVLVGEVWLGGGQSNMGYMIMEKNDTPEIIATAQREAAAAKGAIRFFEVIRQGSDTAQDDVIGHWDVASPDNVGTCSATAWNFGVALHDKLQRPVGLIVSAVGGTPVEAWLPKEVVDSLSVGPAIEKRAQEQLAKDPKGLADFDKKLAAWFQKNPTTEAQDKNRMSNPMPTLAHLPSRFYNAMIHGLEPYGIKGILWYQGDDNARYFQEYPELIKALITTWRKEWGSELPFYYVETQNMTALQVAPVENFRNTASIREVQAAALELPKTDVTTAVDLGGPSTITNPHFPYKKPLGIRLANLALENVYGYQLGEVHCPVYTGFKVEGGAIRVSFDHADGLRARGGGPLKGFVIRGGDGPWVWADAKIEGKDIVVSSAQVPNPTAVRYAWAANPILSVENGVGLPLRPFRTDKETPQ